MVQDKTTKNNFFKQEKEMILFLAFAVTLLCFSGCRGRVDTRPVLTVSVEPLRYFVEQIAGGEYQVKSLMPAGGSPETYQPTPRQMVDLGGSRAYFCFGSLGFERTQLSKMSETAPDVKVFSVSDHIQLMPASFDEIGSKESSQTVDPHVWMSTQNAKLICRNIYNDLCMLDTAKKEQFHRNLTRFLRRIDQLDMCIRARLKNLERRTFLIYHPALGYFAQEYGLKQLNVEQDGREVTPQRMQQLISSCKDERVKTVFIEKEFKGEAARNIASVIHAKVIVINPLQYKWEQEMMKIANSMQR